MSEYVQAVLTWTVRQRRFNMGDPINSADAIMRDGLTWTARQRRFNVDGPAEAV